MSEEKNLNRYRVLIILKAVKTEREVAEWLTIEAHDPDEVCILVNEYVPDVYTDFNHEVKIKLIRLAEVDSPEDYTPYGGDVMFDDESPEPGFDA